MDPEIFESPAEYRFDRFVSSSDGSPPVFTKNGREIDPLKAFVGGTRLCPGRKFITYQIKAYFALLFDKFEIKLKDREEMPKVDKQTRQMRVMQPIGDVVVAFNAR